MCGVWEILRLSDPLERIVHLLRFLSLGVGLRRHGAVGIVGVTGSARLRMRLAGKLVNTRAVPGFPLFSLPLCFPTTSQRNIDDGNRSERLNNLHASDLLSIDNHDHVTTGLYWLE